MNKAVFCVASEAKNIIIGDDCLFANLITIRDRGCAQDL